MNINSQIITPITKQILPALTKRGENISHASLSFTEKTSKTRDLSVKKIINKLIRKKPKFDYVNYTKQTIVNMNEPYDTKVVFANFYKKILIESKETKKTGAAVGELAQKFGQLKHPEIKNIILKHLESTTADKDNFLTAYTDKLKFLTDMTDAVNCLDGCYSQVNCAPVKYYKDIKKKGSWFADALEGQVKDSSHYRNKQITDKKILSYAEYLNKMSSAGDSKITQTFENDIRLAPLREFIDTYIDDYPKTVKKIYDTVYLPKVKPDIRQTFEEIEKKYSCMVIASNGTMTNKDALFLKEEFDLFEKAGGKDAVFPAIFDIDALNVSLRKKGASGVTQFNEDKIIVRDLLRYDAKNNGNTVRHELIHENSKYSELNSKKSIIKAFFEWKTQMLQHKKKIGKELKKAGITAQKAQKYGMSKRWELGPISMEAEHPELYSQQYKDFLKENCYIKDWFFDIKPNKYKIAEEQERIKKIQESFNN